MLKKVIVVDLDGTLLNTNTFHQWIVFLFKKTLFHNPIDSVKIISLSCLRIVKKITHQQLKFAILKISESSRYTPYISEFVEQLHMHINAKVYEYIDNQNNITILATAAPDLYASAIAEKYHFTYCSATPGTLEEEWYENIREKKKESVSALLATLGKTEIDMLLSDHYDDIPVMKMAKKVYLVNGSPSSKEELKKAKITFTCI